MGAVQGGPWTCGPQFLVCSCPLLPLQEVPKQRVSVGVTGWYLRPGTEEGLKARLLRRQVIQHVLRYAEPGPTWNSRR